MLGINTIISMLGFNIILSIINLKITVEDRERNKKVSRDLQTTIILLNRCIHKVDKGNQEIIKNNKLIRELVMSRAKK